MTVFLSRLAPSRYAALCAGIYLFIAVLWVRFSTDLASVVSVSVEEMKSIETWKGYGFVGATSLLFYLFSLSVFRHMRANARELIESQQRLVQADREAMAGVIASSVAHDIANVLTVLRVNTEKLESPGGGLPTVAVSDLKHRIQSGIDRLSDLTDRMRQAGRSALRERPEEYNFASVVADALDFLRAHRTVRACKIEYFGESFLLARGYPLLVHQVIMNLVLNAAEATEGRGRIELRARREGRGITFEVHDDGPGVPAQLRAQIFEAFFTTKKAGSGLGLLSVQSCTNLHGGSIEVGSSPLGGAVFTIQIPDLSEDRMASVKPMELLNKNSYIRIHDPQP